MVWSCLENSDSCIREKEQVDSCLGNGKIILKKKIIRSSKEHAN